MARPPRNNVDYFPFYCKEGGSTFYIEQKYGNDGYAVWVKMLRTLATTDYHYIDLSKEKDTMFFSSKCRLREDTVNEILTDLSKLGEIDQKLWENHRVVYCEKLVDSIKDAYAKRNSKPLSLTELTERLSGLRGNKPSNGKVKGGSNPQSKVKKNKVEKKKGEFIPPTLDEVRAFAKERNSVIDAEKFMAYYQESGWRNAKGRAVKNWKLTAIQWFEGNLKGERPKEVSQDVVRAAKAISEYFNVTEEENGETYGALLTFIARIEDDGRFGYLRKQFHGYVGETKPEYRHSISKWMGSPPTYGDGKWCERGYSGKKEEPDPGASTRTAAEVKEYMNQIMGCG